MDAESNSSELTQLLRRWRDGDRDALDDLLPQVYESLRRMAHARMRAERPDHTLDTSALVHEAYMRIAGADQVDWRDRAHFFAVASTAMRRVLIDHAKQRLAQKRSGARERVDLDAVQLRDPATADPSDLLALDAALVRLSVEHPRQAKAVELRYFSDLTLEESAQVLKTSAPTVLRDLRFAMAWLARDLA